MSFTSRKFEYHSPKDKDFKRAPSDHRKGSFCIIPESSEHLYRKDTIGQGCFGNVGLFDTDVVIKEISFKSDCKDKKEAEKQEKRKLDNIRREADFNKFVYGIGNLAINNKRKVAYLRMKHLPLSLTEHFEGKQFTSVNEFLKLFIAILEAVNYLHTKRKIVHGDLKKCNICIDNKGNILFCDFGLTRWINDKTCGAEFDPISSWNFAPELNGKKIPADPKQDIYALGTLIHSFRHNFQNICDFEAIVQLCTPMMANLPKKRPALKNIISNFKQLVEKKPSDEKLQIKVLIDNYFPPVIPPKNVSTPAASSPEHKNTHSIPVKKPLLQKFSELPKNDKRLLSCGLIFLTVGTIIATAGLALPILLGVGAICFGVGVGATTGFGITRPSFQTWYKEQSKVKKIGIALGIGLLVGSLLALTGGLAMAAFTGIGIIPAITTIFTGDIVAAKSVGGSTAASTIISAGTRTTGSLVLGASLIKAGDKLSSTAQLDRRGLLGSTPPTSSVLRESNAPAIHNPAELKSHKKPRASSFDSSYPGMQYVRSH